jgi:hypothetical protein
VDGVVFQRLAEPGEAIGPGIPVLALDQARLIVKLGVTERDRARMQVDEVVTVAVDHTSVAGTVTSIGPAPETDGLYAIEVTAKPDASTAGALHPGALVDVRFDEPSPVAQLRIPLDAVVHQRDQTFVCGLVGSGDSLKIARLQIELDGVEGREAIVRSGLEAGSRIVAEGGQFLEDGQTVQLLHEGT